MFRLTFLLVAVIGVAMLVAGRDLVEDEVVAQAPVAQAPLVGPESAALPVVAHNRPASVDRLLGIRPVAGVREPAPAVAALPETASGDAAPQVVAAAPVAPRPREFGSVGDEVTAMTTMREGVAAALADATVGFVSGNRVNVRSGPSTDFDVVGQVTFGEAAEILSDDEDGWIRIRIQGDGIEGYIAARFLQDSDPNG